MGIFFKTAAGFQFEKHGLSVSQPRKLDSQSEHGLGETNHTAGYWPHQDETTRRSRLPA